MRAQLQQEMRVVGHQYPGQEDGVAQRRAGSESRRRCACRLEPGEYAATPMGGCCDVVDVMRERCTPATQGAMPWRSEEHTSELQSLMRISYAVFCLKKKNT